MMCKVCSLVVYTASNQTMQKKPVSFSRAFFWELFLREISY
jgi:hypothetical protein